MGKYIRTAKGYINSDYIISVEIADANKATVNYQGNSVDVKGEEDVRELKAALDLPVPRADGYTGTSMHEYPEATSKSRKG